MRNLLHEPKVQDWLIQKELIVLTCKPERWNEVYRGMLNEGNFLLKIKKKEELKS